MTVTADTITEEQILAVIADAERECRVPRIQYISIDASGCVATLIAANWAIGRFDDWYLDDTGYMHRVGGRYADRAACMRNGRARCAEIINARAKETP